MLKFVSPPAARPDDLDGMFTTGVEARAEQEAFEARQAETLRIVEALKARPIEPWPADSLRNFAGLHETMAVTSRYIAHRSACRQGGARRRTPRRRRIRARASASRGSPGSSTGGDDPPPHEHELDREAVR